MLVDKSTYRDVIQFLQGQDTLCVDTETTGLFWWKDRIIGIACEAQDKTFYFPFRHAEGPNLPEEYLEVFRTLLSHPEKTYVGFNYKFDLEFLYAEGIPLPRHIEDAMLSAHLLNENENIGGSFQLKHLGAKYIDPEAKAPQTALIEALKQKGLKNKGTMYQITAEIVGPYAEQDVRLTKKLRDFHIPYLTKHNLYDLWKEVNEYELLLTRVEIRGLKVDAKRTQQLREQSAIEIEKARQKIIELAGREINPSSPRQLSLWLGIPSTAHDVLELLHKQNPNPALEAILLFRGWLKADSTYYKKFMELKDAADLLHPNLRLIGTVTGRLSCSTPNLQAIPRTRPIMRVKECLIPREGYILVQADYSQAELRMGCHYAQEDKMGQLLASGVDIHQATADQLGVDRQVAKAINFGILYGLGPRTLAKNLNISEAKAKGYLQRYHATYPHFKALYKKAQLTAQEKGEIRLWTNRRRKFNMMTPTHKAIANLVQGAVAEMVRVAMQSLAKKFEGEDIHMVLQVHDSVLFEIPEARLDWALPIIKYTMEHPLEGTRYEDYSKHPAAKFAYPFTVDIKYGPSMADEVLVKWEPEKLAIAS